jgi:predicted transcriptional regulator
MTDFDLIDIEIRRRIYNYLLKNPGIHLREISRKLKIPKTTLRYHLIYMEKRTLITTENNSRYCRYFASNMLGKKDRDILNVIRNDSYRNIILIILRVWSPQKNISKILNKDPSTISIQMKKLEKMGIVEQVSMDNGRLYRVKDFGEIIDFLIRNKKTLINKEILSKLEELNKWYDKKDKIDIISGTIRQVFPHPYYG